MYICTRGIDLAPISTLFQLACETILTLWHLLVFHFISYIKHQRRYDRLFNQLHTTRHVYTLSIWYQWYT